MLFDLDWIRDAGFRRAPVVVSQAGSDISDPGSDDFFHATGADQLVELHIGDGADQCEVGFFLANDFVTGGERNKRFQGAAHCDRVAVFDVESDGVMERAELVHTRFLYLLRSFSSISVGRFPAYCWVK